ncbi:hypothetical protein [Streptomyces litchfieldiae]|uniref:Uncharacterized protein n=1 Tax=Streptomyces litchfieldiae TaxID=3075543 RepID=A0ABU2MPT9_9ACTN|nr:hypothetical protein [Streptomyces sp. DSM 44938]MDT0343642.1 hypothetical protein [Streptomyces sp. DSM 44938]
MSGSTATSEARKAGRMDWSSSSETRPTWPPPFPPPPHADSSGMPPTAAVATAVEVRKLLRLSPEREFGMAFNNP